MLQYRYRADAPPTRRTREGNVQSWSDYSPIIDRPKIHWPSGAHVAVWVCPNVLSWEFTPPADPWLEAWARMPQPDVLAYGRQDYGNRVGFWRMLDVLDKHDTPCTAVVNADALARYPSIRDAVKERRWRFLGHGMSNTRFIYGHGEAEERAYYEEIRDTVATLTGMPMLGMGGPGPQSATESTPDILAELGFLYHGDWYHDDQPMPLRVRSGRLISVPYAAEVNDAPFLGSAFEAADFLDMRPCVTCSRFLASGRPPATRSPSTTCRIITTRRCATSMRARKRSEQQSRLVSVGFHRRAQFGGVAGGRASRLRHRRQYRDL
jgi:hypothetical protein